MIRDLVSEWGRDAGHRLAVIGSSGSATYSELDAMIVDLNEALIRYLDAGETFVALTTPSMEAVAILLAAEESGHPVVLLSPALSVEESCELLRRSHAPLLILPTVASLHVPFCQGSLLFAAERFQLRSNPEFGALERPDPLGEKDAFFCQMTSGSTGASRLAVRTRRGVLEEVRAIVQRLELSSADRILTTSSIAHSYGLIGGLLAPLSVGASVVLAANARHTWTSFRAMHPTGIFGLPTMYEELLQSNELQSLPLSSLRWALSAGAPVAPRVYANVRDRFGLLIRQDYGTTETGTIAIDWPGEPNPETVGWPLSHVGVRLQPFSRGKDEEIQVEGAAVAAGYAMDGHLVPCTDDTGWYHTADAGGWDAEGRLRVGRRLRPIITVQGVTVELDTIERVIGALPGVRNVVVLALERGGEPWIKAVVVAPGVAPHAVSTWCCLHLPKAMRPTLIELRDELPRSPAGKILEKYLL